MKTNGRRYWLFYRQKRELTLGRSKLQTVYWSSSLDSPFRCSLALPPRRIWQMVHHLSKIPPVESFWSVGTDVQVFYWRPWFRASHYWFNHGSSALLCCRKKGEQALGRSRGGYSTKIHVSVDGLGNPLELRITGGEKSDITQGEELIEGWQRKDTKVIGDKGYDADKLIEKIGEAQAVIPPKRNRKTQRHYDKHLYKERHLIECFFHKLKQYRHLFSRFDKLARNFLSFLYLVSALFWLKWKINTT